MKQFAMNNTYDHKYLAKLDTEDHNNNYLKLYNTLYFPIIDFQFDISFSNKIDIQSLVQMYSLSDIHIHKICQMYLMNNYRLYHHPNVQF